MTFSGITAAIAVCRARCISAAPDSAPLRRMLAVVLTACVAVSLASCRDRDRSVRLKEPTVFNEVANADLSPVPPHGPTRPGESAPRWRRNANASYPGDDTVFTKKGRRAYAAKRGRQGVLETGDGYELNFADAPLPELTKVILKDTLKIPYVYDARVQGTVTLSTGRAVSRDELLTALETVLQMNRGALVREDGGFRIVAETVIKNGGAVAVDYAAEADRVGPGYGITVFPLHFVSSETMLKVLSAFVAKSGALRADVRQNLLLVRGTGQERRSLLDVAAQFDADWMKGQSVGIFPLRHAVPENVIRELKQIFQAESGGLGKDVVRFEPMARLKAVLVLASRSKYLRRAEQWIRRLDRTNEAEIRTFVYHVENGKAKDLAKLINDIFAGESSIASDSTSDETTPEEENIDISDPDALSETTGDDRQSDQATDVTSVAARPGTRNGQRADYVRVVADETKNNLIIRTSGLVFAKMKPVLRDLDKAPAQVIINATLAEVTLNDNLRYGVQVFLRNNENNRLGGFTNGNALDIAPDLPGLSYLVGLRASPKLVLDALANETSVRVVSSPSVVVLDNQPATLQVGNEVPIATRAAQSVTDPEAPIVNNIEFRDTGVILKVTPRINNEGVVTMEIEQEISAVVNATPAGAPGSLTPTISQRRIASTISVNSGQMVVLGGLIAERKDNAKNRVPIWEKVPFLGQFPGRTDNKSERTELVVFLRPQVMRNAVEASLIAEELRARLRSLVPQRKRKYKRWPEKRRRAARVHAPKPFTTEVVPAKPAARPRRSYKDGTGGYEPGVDMWIND